MFRRVLVAFTAFLALVASLGTTPAPAQLVGGYQPINVADPAVVAAAQFAVVEKGARFARVLKAESQVVAGRNYRMLLDVTSIESVREAQVVVYADLKNQLKLTSWEWTGAARAVGKEVKAADVKLVVYAKGDKVGGAFTFVGKKNWVEDTSDGRHRFTEVDRDEWSVYLDVDNGDYSIQIDLYKQQIFIKDKGKERRDLYNVLKAY